MRYWIATICRVQEERARLAVVMGESDDLVEQIACPHLSPGLTIARIDQREVAVFLDRLHEDVGDADRDIEVGDLAFFALTGDEILDVGVIDTQNSHVGPAARAALRHLAERAVVGLEEAHGAGGDARAGSDAVALGPQTRKGKAVAAAGLLDQRGVAQRLEDAVRSLAQVI